MKILVLGPVASGKSTLAKKLEDLLGINAYEIDKIIHDDSKNQKREEKEQRKIINDIIRKNKEWIIEGMPRKHLEVLAANATLIVYIDIPKKKRKKNLFYRNLKIRLGLIKIDYKLDRELIRKMKEYIEQEDNSNLKKVMKKYPSKVIILKRRKEVEKLLIAIKDGKELKYQ